MYVTLPHSYILQLTNIADCIKKGNCQEGTTPLEVASQQLLKDQVHILHTIGGNDTKTRKQQCVPTIFTPNMEENIGHWYAQDN
jgi:hypothetical protein